jgi:hypothetical protein
MTVANIVKLGTAIALRSRAPSRSLLAAAVLATPLIAAPAEAKQPTGYTLYSHCVDSARDRIYHTACVGYLAGIFDGMRFASARSTRRPCCVGTTMARALGN